MYGLLCVSHILWSFTFTSSNTNNLRLIKHGFDILQAWHISVGDKFKMYYAIWGILLEIFFFKFYFKTILKHLIQDGETFSYHTLF